MKTLGIITPAAGEALQRGDPVHRLVINVTMPEWGLEMYGESESHALALGNLIGRSLHGCLTRDRKRDAA